MSIQNKIVLSFLLSFSIIIILGISAYFDFYKIKDELISLEIAEIIRTNSLQLRRHEKNYFLYTDLNELQWIYRYLDKLRSLSKKSHKRLKTGLNRLEKKINEYQMNINRIKTIGEQFHSDINILKKKNKSLISILDYAESTYLEHPVRMANLIIMANPNKSTLSLLNHLNQEIKSLRSLGENILQISIEINVNARTRMENIISLSQTSALILIPIAFIVGLFLLIIISQNVVKRLKLLMNTVEQSAKGDFPMLPVPQQDDEVSKLIRTFNRMEEELINRDEELFRKEQELLQNKKLAALGTLAAGVAHELNNPLSNIYLAAQTISREMNEINKNQCPPIIRTSINDINSQTVRVKKIVSNLLEFARGRKPELGIRNLKEIIDKVYSQLESLYHLTNINFTIEGIETAYVDGKQMEQVFINLFNNAIDAMSYQGILKVILTSDNNNTFIQIIDTGSGIQENERERVFEPFFSTKHNGTGLGLSIVYNIINNHGGDIHIDPNTTSGTKLIISLPKKRISE